MESNENLDERLEQVRKDKNKGLAIMISGFLFALMGFLSTLNIEFEWLSEASINSFTILLVAGAQLVITLYATWKNTFTGKKAQKQNRELKKKGLR